MRSSGVPMGHWFLRGWHTCLFSTDSDTVVQYGSGSGRRARIQQPATYAHTDSRRGTSISVVPHIRVVPRNVPAARNPHPLRRNRQTSAPRRVLLARATMEQHAPSAGGRQAHRRSTAPRRRGCRGAAAALVAAAAAGATAIATAIAGAAAQSTSCSAYLDMTCFYPRVSVHLVRRPATTGMNAGARLGRRWGSSRGECR